MLFSLKKYFTDVDGKQDLSQLQTKLVLSNKPLMEIIKANLPAIEEHLYEALLSHEDNLKVNEDSELYKLKKRMYQPKGYHRMVFSFQKSMPRLQNLLKEIKDF